MTERQIPNRKPFSTRDRFTSAMHSVPAIFKISTLSSMGCLLGDLLLYPLDTVNTRVKIIKSENVSLIQCAKRVFKSEGLRGFYPSIRSLAACNFAANSIYFYSYENLRKFVTKEKKRVETSQFFQRNPTLKHLYTSSLTFCNAAGSSCASVLLFMPLDAVKTRLQAKSSGYQYTGIFDGLKKMVKDEGVLRLFKAANISLPQSMLYLGVQYTIYEKLRDEIIYLQGRNMNLVETLVNVMASSCVAGLLSNPLNLLKVRSHMLDESHKKTSNWQLLKTIFKEEGWKSFSKGYAPRMLNAGLFAVIYFPIFEYSRVKFSSDMI